jgi:hypothetical protein
MRAWMWITLAALSACTGESKETADTAPTVEPLTAEFDVIVERVFVPSCVEGCHSTADRIADLPLEDADEAYEALLNQPPTNSTAIVAGLSRVDPGNLDNSLLHIKITDPMGIGTIMPPGDSLTDEEIAVIAEWIEAGAER